MNKFRDFPTSFRTPERLNPANYTSYAGDALRSLEDDGFYIERYTAVSDVDGLARISAQRGVRRYCRKDIGRWGTVENATAQLAKKGGRLGFKLIQASDGYMAGHGWTGIEPCAELPDADTTSAFRLDGEFAGQGLAARMTKVIIGVTKADHAPDDGIGLETWASNIPANATYRRAGAQFVTARADWRPALEDEARAIETPDGLMVMDVRRFYQFPEELFVDQTAI
jgi:hypothetical protein